MISPTGKGPRKTDSHGSGSYGSKRGDRLHEGTDYICDPGQSIYSPIDGVIRREAKPYAGKEYSGVLIRNDWCAIKMFYFKPDYNLIGKQVKKGQIIGMAQDISEKYSGMIPHIHLEICHINPEIFIGML